MTTPAGDPRPTVALAVTRTGPGRSGAGVLDRAAGATPPGPPPGSRPGPAHPVPPRPAEPTSRGLRWAGEILVTLGVVVLLFAFYEVYVTNWLTQHAQTQVSQELTRRWAAAGGPGLDSPGDGGPGNGTAAGTAAGADVATPVAGTPEFRLTLPSLGPAHTWTVVAGTDQDALALGPGHYAGTAAPGELGNLAIAGHRVGRGAPFNDLGELGSCDPVVVETATGWVVYRVLPLADEVAGWDTGRGATPACAGLRPLDAQVPGREIVAPSDVGVIEPVPNRPGVAPAAPLITMTTCNPKFSARQRLVVHGVLDRIVPKTPGGGLPPELAGPL